MRRLCLRQAIIEEVLYNKSVSDMIWQFLDIYVSSYSILSLTGLSRVRNIEFQVSVSSAFKLLKTTQHIPGSLFINL